MRTEQGLWFPKLQLVGKITKIQILFIIEAKLMIVLLLSCEIEAVLDAK